tara:strand:+ start:3651 stop:4136 length:486 start_codon:yes stop_codon:yes gene_type:complete
MPSGLKVRARRGRPKKHISSDFTENRASKRSSSSCFLKKLYHQGFIPFESVQAGYYFYQLQQKYLFYTGAPYQAFSRTYNLSRTAQDSQRPHLVDEEDQWFLEWKVIMRELNCFGPKGKALLWEVFEEKEAFMTCNDLFVLKEVLDHLVTLCARFSLRGVK